MNNLLKVAAIMMAMFFMANSSCDKDDINGIKTSGFNTQFELGVNEKAILPKEIKELLVTLKSLTDSRCPKDVQCVWAGNAVTEVQFNSNDGAEKIISLCIGKCDKNTKSSDTTAVSLNNKNYRVVLNDVKGKGINKAVITIIRQ